MLAISENIFCVKLGIIFKERLYLHSILYCPIFIRKQNISSSIGNIKEKTIKSYRWLRFWILHGVQRVPTNNIDSNYISNMANFTELCIGR